MHIHIFLSCDNICHGDIHKLSTHIPKCYGKQIISLLIRDVLWTSELHSDIYTKLTVMKNICLLIREALGRSIVDVHYFAYGMIYFRSP